MGEFTVSVLNGRIKNSDIYCASKPESQQKECKLDSCLVKGTQKQVRPLQETNYPVLAYQDASMKSILLDLQSHKPIYWTTQTPS